MIGLLTLLDSLLLILTFGEHVIRREEPPVEMSNGSVWMTGVVLPMSSSLQYTLSFFYKKPSYKKVRLKKSEN